MDALDAFDKIYREHLGAEALLTMMADYGEGMNLDPTIIYSIEAIRNILASEREAFDVLDRFIADEVDRPSRMLSME